MLSILAVLNVLLRSRKRKKGPLRDHCMHHACTQWICFIAIVLCLISWPHAREFQVMGSYTDNLGIEEVGIFSDA